MEDSSRTTAMEQKANSTAQLLEQYKLYVEMADHISARRSLSNSFFLTSNTVVLSVLGVVGRVYLQQNVSGLVAVLVVLGGAIMFCLAWRSILKSYARLNAAKFQIIHEMEEKLPAQPYKTEWTRLGYGENTKRYRPLSDAERRIPLGFILMYFILGIYWAIAIFFRI